MGRAELESAVWRLVTLHSRGGLSQIGLVDALVLLMVEYAAGDGVEMTAARRTVLARTDGGQ